MNRSTTLLAFVATVGNTSHALPYFLMRICSQTQNFHRCKHQLFSDLYKIYLMIRIPSLAPTLSTTSVDEPPLATACTLFYPKIPRLRGLDARYAPERAEFAENVLR
jgi:hypothetical protein